MPLSKRPHPVKRIRQALEISSERSGLRMFATSRGFASLIDRSVSSVRNVESGSTKKWDRLAKQIEKKTGISAEWMLSKPDPTEPILAIDGKPWNPEEAMDPLAGRDTGWNWNMLLEVSPESVVRLATKMVETRLSLDLLRKNDSSAPVTRGGNDFLRNLVRLIDDSESFRDPEFVNEVNSFSVRETPLIMGKIVRTGSRGGFRSGRWL